MVCGPSSSRRLLLAALAGYLLIAVLLFHNAWFSSSPAWMGTDGDAKQFIWYLDWTPYAISHGISPLTTTHIMAPGGANLMWSPLMLPAGLVLWPITATAGPVIAYEVLVTVAVALSAWCGMLACRCFVPGHLAPLVGGALLGFSPFVVGHAQGQPDLAFAAFPPLAVVLLHRLYIRQQGNPWRTGALLGGLATLQLMLGEELLVSTALLGLVATVLLAVLHRPLSRRRVEYAARGLLAAALVFSAAAAYPVAVQFLGPDHVSGVVQPWNYYVTDLAALVVPVWPLLLHAQSAGFMRDPYEIAYIGIPAGVVLLATMLRRDRGPAVRFAAIMAGIAVVLSLGASLHVDGRDTHVPLPGAILDGLPLLRDLLPSRFMVDAFLFVAILLAIALHHAMHELRARRLVVATTVACVAVSLLPALDFPATHPDIPAYFRAGGGLASLPRGSVVLVMPYAHFGSSEAMLWQAESGMAFRMPEGHALVPESATVPWPADRRSTAVDVDAQRYLLTEGRSVVPGGRFSADPSILQSEAVRAERGLPLDRLDASLAGAARAELRDMGVRAVVVGPMPGREALVHWLSVLLAGPPRDDGGVQVWRLG